MTDTTVRVFVPTYRRPHLLPRALASLRAQTHGDWTAEVHNDAPDDDRPAGIVRSLADDRIRYVRHEQNIGGIASFNLAFAEQSAPFVAILEDDNWWRADFLERMVRALEAHPHITVAWANQSIWEEDQAGNWRDAQRTVRPISESTLPQEIAWPHFSQCFGGLHAHGTILLRTRPGRTYPTPAMDLGGVEAVRERAFPHPLLYIPEPLGVFGATWNTNRSPDRLVWATHQVLLAASFFKHVSAPPAYWQGLWGRARTAPQRMTSTLLIAARQEPALRHHLHHATAEDWRYFALRSLRRPTVCVKLLRSRVRAPRIWAFLDRHTADRAADAQGGGGATTPCTVSPLLP